MRRKGEQGGRTRRRGGERARERENRRGGGAIRQREVRRNGGVGVE